VAAVAPIGQRRPAIDIRYGGEISKHSQPDHRHSIYRQPWPPGLVSLRQSHLPTSSSAAARYVRTSERESMMCAVEAVEALPEQGPRVPVRRPRGSGATASAL